jgi:hypothetical protein
MDIPSAANLTERAVLLIGAQLNHIDMGISKNKLF